MSHSGESRLPPLNGIKKAYQRVLGLKQKRQIVAHVQNRPDSEGVTLSFLCFKSL